jgi:cytochrome P450
VARELGREVDRRRAAPTPPDDALDLLDVVVAAAPPEVDETELGEVFLSSLFAVAGSIGFTLGWTVFLLGTHRLVASEPRWAVREALRLWPVAWLLGRRPTVAHTVAGIRVTPEDEVVVCPYLVHRHPKYWQHPTEFVPERWATQTELRAYMPFGRGPHTCAAAAISLEIVEALLPILLVGSRWTVETIDHRPRVDAALAPPRFVLRRPARGVVKSIERR